MKLIFIFALILSSCTGFDKSKNDQQSNLETEDMNQKYSQSSQRPQIEQRDYIRMTKEKLEKDSDLGPTAGSMWVMDGQGAYLFAQNKMRQEGDLLNVKLEGPLLKQAETKVSVIKKLLDQLDLENKKWKEKDKLSPNQKSDTQNERNLASEDKKDEAKLEIESIPTRITEKMPDGTYKITGQQPFMLGQREFKVLISGLIRPEDFSDEGTSSNRILDSSLDVLSVRKKRNEAAQ